ncbi:MAG: hypothetical protein ACHQ50_07225 [Fimbriimonadales bacterium]
MKFNYKLSALSVALALACLGAKAQADIVVLRQHNFIQAVGGAPQSDSSDSLTSWNGSVSSSNTQGSYKYHATASLSSTIAANSVTLLSSTYASLTLPPDVPPSRPATATATTQLQFTVSATRTYQLVVAPKGDGFEPPAIQLLRDGVVVLSGPFSGAFLFEAGHTYEFDGSAPVQSWGGGYRSGYKFSMR